MKAAITQPVRPLPPLQCTTTTCCGSESNHDFIDLQTLKIGGRKRERRGKERGKEGRKERERRGRGKGERKEGREGGEEVKGGGKKERKEGEGRRRITCIGCGMSLMRLFVGHSC